MHARDLIHLAERIYVITMPETGHGSGHYQINDEDTFVEQIAQHPSFKGCNGPHASGVYILTFEADTPETEQLTWIAQILSGTHLNDGQDGLIRVRYQPSLAQSPYHGAETPGATEIASRD
jgi:hypothetical protein